jgi:alpha-amylase
MNEQNFEGGPAPTLATNGAMVQGFTWYLPEDGRHWKRLARLAPKLADMGVTAVWLPPAYKAAGGKEGVGYSVYDLWDLGEFDQCGSVETKYGSKDDYLACIRALQAAGIQVLADIVFNQRSGGDEIEHVRAFEVDPTNRLQVIGEEETIAAWTRFRFPGRGGAYSDFRWDWTCFHGSDLDEDTDRHGVFLFAGKSWDDDVDASENGNFDYLMAADVDVNEPRVAEELTRWGRWYLAETGIDGLRLDALKHVSKSFFRSWLAQMRETTDRELFCVGEYWSPDVEALLAYLDEDEPMSLFDVPLHYRLFRASNSMGQMDLRTLFDDTLVASDPLHAVTFVDNHDTQPGQSLQSTVEGWFKPSAYMAILLREAGYPCVFFGDLFGTPGPEGENDEASLPAVQELPLLMEARRKFSYGEQHDYLDDPDLIGWTREGDAAHPKSGLAAVITDGEGGEKHMYVGEAHAGETWWCVVGPKVCVEIDDEGYGDFPTPPGMGSLYVSQEAYDMLDHEPCVRHVSEIEGFELPEPREGEPISVNAAPRRRRRRLFGGFRNE